MTSTTLRLEWSVPWASGTLRADCKVGGSVVATDQVRTAGAAARVALSADRTTIRADGKDLVFVTGDIQDANGVIVPNAENSVSFSVSGPGQLVGVDNGNPIDTTSYKGTSRKAFSGKVLAIVRSTGTAGSIVVTATSSGLTSTPGDRDRPDPLSRRRRAGLLILVVRVLISGDRVFPCSMSRDRNHLRPSKLHHQ